MAKQLNDTEQDIRFSISGIDNFLLKEGLITREQLDQAVSDSKATGITIQTTLVNLGCIDEKVFGNALSRFYSVEYVDLRDQTLNEEVMTLLPESFMRENWIIPVQIDSKRRRLDVAMVFPDNVRLIDDISLRTEYRVNPVVGTVHGIINAIDHFFTDTTTVIEALSNIQSEIEENEDEKNVVDLYDDPSIESAPIVKLVTSILQQAIQESASDIHIEPQGNRIRVRFRIDGILRHIKSIPSQLGAGILSRIKIISGMDIAVTRRPQDGHMVVKMGSKEIDMRVNTTPSQFGETAVIRVIRSSGIISGLDSLKLNENESALLKHMIHSPHGIVLITGPTGSGKTSTLYSCLREMNSLEQKIITIEDPIEYPIPGVIQTPVSKKTGLTFPSCMRSMLRQDPDVIMVGEIRDNDTLDTAIHAALTGHLVFSTIHSNNAAKTIARLLKMGAENYLISSSLIGIVAQRLVRKICENCKVTYTAPIHELQLLDKEDGQDEVTLSKGTGCDQCAQSGYHGRMGVLEIMNITPEVRALIDDNASITMIEKQAIKDGMVTLKANTINKVINGETTVEEFKRVIGTEM